MKKKKLFEVSIINKTQSKSLLDGVKFYTSDTALELGFELLEVEYSFDSAEILLLNVDDRSFVTRTANKSADGFTYEIEDDIVAHYGEWKAQLKFEKDGEVYVSSPVVFRIENDLGNDRPPQLTDVNNWERLKQSAKDLITEMGDIVANETARIEAEKLRVEGYQEVRNFIDNFEIGENAVGTENIKDNAVTIQKADFIHKSKNLFDKNKAMKNKWWARVNGYVVMQDNALLNAHPAIPVSQGETYYKNGTGHIIFTDENNYTLYAKGASEGAGAHTVPANGAYMYVNVYHVDLDTYQIEKGNVGTAYEPFSITLDKGIKIESDSVDLPEIDLNGKQDRLVAGENIVINQDNVISAISNATNPKMVKVTRAGDVTVYMPIEKNEYASYRFSRNVNEDYMKMNQNGIYTLDDDVSLINFGSVEGSALIAPTSANPYVTVVGTKVITNFFGSGIKIVTYADNRGGAWKISIDGEDYGTHSTWSDVVVQEKTLFEKLNLPTDDHTIILEYTGVDPNNVVTSPRGWLKRTDQGVWEVYGDVEAKKLTPKFELTDSSSNKEFAFNVSPLDKSVGEWFPQHNGIGTTTIGTKGIQTLELDGQVIDLNTPSELIEFDNGTFSQVAYSKLSSETDDRAKIVISYNFEKTVKQYFEMEFLKDTVINKGYAFMLPARGDFAGKFKSNARETKQAETVSTDIDIPFTNININEIIATSDSEDKSSFFVRTKWENTYGDIVSAFLQSRAIGLQKVYPLFLERETVNAGTILYFDGEWEIGKLKNANEIYG